MATRTAVPFLTCWPSPAVHKRHVTPHHATPDQIMLLRLPFPLVLIPSRVDMISRKKQASASDFQQQRVLSFGSIILKLLFLPRAIPVRKSVNSETFDSLGGIFDSSQTRFYCLLPPARPFFNFLFGGASGLPVSYFAQSFTRCCRDMR